MPPGPRELSIRRAAQKTILTGKQLPTDLFQRTGLVEYRGGLATLLHVRREWNSFHNTWEFTLHETMIKVLHQVGWRHCMCVLHIADVFTVLIESIGSFTKGKIKGTWTEDKQQNTKGSFTPKIISGEVQP